MHVRCVHIAGLPSRVAQRQFRETDGQTTIGAEVQSTRWDSNARPIRRSVLTPRHVSARPSTHQDQWPYHRHQPKLPADLHRMRRPMPFGLAVSGVIRRAAVRGGAHAVHSSFQRRPPPRTGPREKDQSTDIVAPMSVSPFIFSIAPCASFWLSYSTSA